MAHPKSQGSGGARGKRRSHDKLKGVQLVKAADGSLRLPHVASQTTGTYKGRTVIDVAKRAARRAKRLKKIS